MCEDANEILDLSSSSLGEQIFMKKYDDDDQEEGEMVMKKKLWYYIVCMYNVGGVNSCKKKEFKKFFMLHL